MNYTYLPSHPFASSTLSPGPVIIMTSRGEDHARQAGLEAGCSAYLLKNEFDQDELVSTVRRLVGR